MVQPREEGLVFKRLFDERVDSLLEREIDANADRTVPLRGVGRGRSLVGVLHETGTAARDDRETAPGERGA